MPGALGGQTRSGRTHSRTRPVTESHAAGCGTWRQRRYGRGPAGHHTSDSRSPRQTAPPASVIRYPAPRDDRSTALTPAALARPSARPGGGTPLSPYDDRAFGEFTEPFRHGAAHRARTPSAPRPLPARPPRRGPAWLLPAAAATGLVAGVALAHGLLLACGLVLAGLLGRLLTGSGAGGDRRGRV